MGSRTISLKDEAYHRLKALKSEDKSFSDVVIELTEDSDQGLAKLRDIEIDYTVEELIDDRKEGLTGEKREDLLR